MPEVTKLQLRLVDPETFLDEFYKAKHETGLSDRKVFDVLNKIFRKTYGIDRYSSYDSFRVARNRRINKKCNNVS